jgi:hypothetical protein
LNHTGRQNQADQDRQNSIGRTGQAEQDSQNRTARTGQPEQDRQDRTAMRVKKSKVIYIFPTSIRHTQQLIGQGIII